MDFIYLPEPVVYNIYYWLLYKTKAQDAGLKNLANLRCASKKFALTSAKILDVIQHSDKSRALLEWYTIKKLCVYIRTSNITSYTAFITLLLNRVKSRWLSRLRSQQLLYAARFSTVEFLKQYTDLDFHSLTPVRFTEKNIIKATDIANERKDGNDMLIYLCPMMISLCFIISDPQHIHMIMNHIKSGNKLNSSGDYFRDLFEEARYRKRFGYTIQDSALLLPLLNPPRKDILVVPKGTIFRRFNMNPPVKKHGKLFSKLSQRFMITMNDGIATISYFDYRTKIRTINVHERNGTYTYEDFSTDSLYELFVRTSIFAQIYGTFEQQHVALTEENIDLDPIDQPWFFGAISEQEADEILSHAAAAPAIITRAIGADIYVCYTRSKFTRMRRSNYRLTMKFRDILTRTDHSYPKFYSALHNGGERKNLWVYLTYRTVVSKPLDEIIKFIKDNGIKLSDPVFRTPNLLEEYVKTNMEINSETVKYLVDQGVPLDSDTMMDYFTNKLSSTNYNLIFWLIEKGAKFSDMALIRAIQKYCPDISTFKIYLDATDSKYTISDVIITTALRNVILTHDTINPVPKTREKLVKLAWKFGNEDNYFKKLPKELIEVICRSTDIDRPDWWDIMAPLMLNTDVTQIFLCLSSVGLFEMAPFVNNFWDQFKYEHMEYYTNRLISQLPAVAKSHKNKAPMIVEWTLNFVRTVKNVNIANYYDAMDFFTFVILNDFAHPLLEAMLSVMVQSCVLGAFLQVSTRGIDLSPVRISERITPGTWGAVLVNNRPLIKFFLEKGYLHFDKPDASFDRLKELVKSTNAGTSGLDYLRQLMSK